RPDRLFRTMPARCNTRRCLVTAWRDMPAPLANREIDRGSPLASDATSASLVRSPNAAKVAACEWERERLRFARGLRILTDICLYVRHLDGPAVIVHAKSFGPSACGNLVEARLSDRQACAVGDFFETKLHERRRFMGVICLRVDGVRMPGER